MAKCSGRTSSVFPSESMLNNDRIPPTLLTHREPPSRLHGTLRFTPLTFVMQNRIDVVLEDDAAFFALLPPRLLRRACRARSLFDSATRSSSCRLSSSWSSDQSTELTTAAISTESRTSVGSARILLTTPDEAAPAR